MIRDYKPWIILVAAPLLLNVFLWLVWIRPEQARLRHWSELSRLDELKPRMETLLAESQTLLNEERQTDEKNNTAILDELQHLAREARVEIQNSKIKESGNAGVSIALTVNGGFDRLAQWVSEIEKIPSLQMNTWTLQPAKELNRPHQLNVDVALKGSQ